MIVVVWGYHLPLPDIQIQLANLHLLLVVDHRGGRRAIDEFLLLNVLLIEIRVSAVFTSANSG